jgi:hypothetical protein
MFRKAERVLAAQRGEVDCWKTAHRYGYRGRAGWGIARRECRRAERRLGRALCFTAAGAIEPVEVREPVQRTTYVGGVSYVVEFETF